jgi:hypothetical protein
MTAFGRPSKGGFVRPVEPDGVVQRLDVDGVSVATLNPLLSREEARRRMLESARAAADRAFGLRESLLGLLTVSNPLDAYLHLVAFEQLTRRAPIGEVHGLDAGVEFIGGLVTSMTAQTVVAGLDRPVSAKLIHQLIETLRAFMSNESAANFAALDGEDARHMEARLLLTLERQFDRTAGYPQHLRRIVWTVLGPMDEATEAALGVRPLQVLAAADAHTSEIEQVGEESGSVAEDVTSAIDGFLGSRAAACGRDPVASVARNLRIGPDRARHLLDAISTEVGSQSVTSLVSENRLRCFPVIKLGERRVWSHPYDFLHETLDWFDQYLLEHGAHKLRDRFSRLRGDVTEDLVEAEFARIFGRQRVHRGLEYQLADGTWAETDVVVDLPGIMIVCEAKARRLTPKGRSAEPDRVRTKFDELVVEPLAQAERARSALRSGSPFRTKGKRPVNWSSTPDQVIRVVVSLDRVDPFAMELPDLAAEQRDVWFVSLADFLSVVGLVDDPAALLAYIINRIDQNVHAAPRIYMESDALGAWFDRREGAWDVAEDEHASLEYESDAINDFYTTQDMHDRHPDRIAGPDPISLGIPEDVTAFLADLLDAGDSDWAAAAQAVFGVKPGEWSVVVQDLKRVGRPVRSRTQRRAQRRLVSGHVMASGLQIIVGDRSEFESDGESAILRVGPTRHS